MAGQDVPPLDQSVAGIRDTLKSIRLDLMTGTGYKIQHFPWDFESQFKSLYTVHQQLAAAVVKGTPWLTHPIYNIGNEISLLKWAIVNGVWPGLVKSIDKVSAAVSGDIGARIAECATQLIDIALGVEVIPGHIDDHTVVTQYGFQGVEAAILALMHSLAGQLAKLSAATDKLAGVDAEAVKAVLAPALKEGLEGVGDVKGKVDEELGGSVQERAGSTVSSGVEHGAATVEPMAKQAEKVAKAKPADALAMLGKGADGLPQAMIDMMMNIAPHSVAEPKDAWRNVSAAYTMAMTLGMLSHSAAAVADAGVLGSGLLKTMSVAKLLCKFAGFDPIVNAISGTIYNNWLKVPLNYETNKTGRQYIPGPGDLQRFQSKRIFDGFGPKGKRKKPPYDFRQSMAYWGFSDKWIDTMEDDLYREPGTRDLIYLAETANVTEKWWLDKATRLGYSDEDLKNIPLAMKRRAARTQILDHYRRLWYLCAEGFITTEVFKSRCGGTGLPKLAIDQGADAAKAERERLDKRNYLAWIRAAYARDQLRDDQLRDHLDQLYKEPKLADRIYKTERLKRYHAVYRTTPSEKARAAIPVYKRAFLAGQKTEPEYRTALSSAGLTNDMIDLTVSLDSPARDRKVISELRRYQLPDFRDQVLHGLMTIDEYRATLTEKGFPAVYLPDEIHFVQQQFTRRQQQTVKAAQLPHYRRAYVVGLIDDSQLDQVMTDAGLTEAQVQAEHLTLDYQRQLEEEKAFAAAAAAQAKAHAAAGT